MPISFHSGGAWRTARDLWYHTGGSWQRIQQAWVHTGGAWQKVHQLTSPALAVIASPSSFINSYSSVPAGTGSFSENFVATASGGAGGYSFAWARLSTTGLTACTSAGTATATLALSGSWAHNANVTFTETWRVTVTDSVGATATFDISLSVEVENGS